MVYLTCVFGTQNEFVLQGVFAVYKTGEYLFYSLLLHFAVPVVSLQRKFTPIHLHFVFPAATGRDELKSVTGFFKCAVLCRATEVAVVVIQHRRAIGVDLDATGSARTAHHRCAAVGTANG